MKNLRFLFLGMLFSATTGTSITLQAMTIDEVRELKKDELINCYGELLTCVDAMNTEMQRLKNRSTTETFKESFAYGQVYGSLSISESLAHNKLYENSIQFRQLKELYNRQAAQCKFIQQQVPTKNSTESTTNE